MKVKNSHNNTNSNFWISYADLMAGLLFIFILVLGAIFIRYYFAKQDLSTLKSNLVIKEQNLELSNKELEKKQKMLSDVLQSLNVAKDQNKQLEILNEWISSRLIDLESNATNLESSNLSFKQELQDANSALNDLNSTVLFLQNEILDLQNVISSKDAKYQELYSDFNITKQRVKSLSGIRVKVIETLQKELGNDIKIDQNSGAISLSSSVLFDVGSSDLKEESKQYLKNTLQKYLNILLSDEIRPNIDQIMIEGHTDSDGGYLYNLDLSQKRAYEVMKFIYTWNNDKKLQNYLVASGRSFLDTIKVNGVEDKQASRRIEIKFSISNKEAMKEIEKFLELKNN